jgi:superfamily I DNA and RNA helicase
MELNTSMRYLKRDPIACDLYNFFKVKREKLNLSAAHLWHNFPVYKEEEGGIIKTRLLVISQIHGIVVFEVFEQTELSEDSAVEIDYRLDQICSHIVSRLIRYPGLRKTKVNLRFPINAAIYAPALKEKVHTSMVESNVLINDKEVCAFLKEIEESRLEDKVFQEILSTIEGAKGLIRPKRRNVQGQPPDSKIYQVIKLESEINRFDQQQRHGYVIPVDGPQRIRGIAGSGKTVVLSMKAAFTHLQYPEATIVYTFYTKSLYQHIKRLITRFYRQYDDLDPDWEKLRVMHGWGGHSAPGVYFEACKEHDVTPMTFNKAAAAQTADPFGFACSKLLEEEKVECIYDYIFIDEGQDFPASFMKLCKILAKQERFILAYDELQTIWRARAPSYMDIFGEEGSKGNGSEFIEDVVLYKCYRNPREILVCAHALGFGIYGKRIVQMLENSQHWEDVGYNVIKGDFKAGSETIIERPEDNSLKSISEGSSFDEIIFGKVYDTQEKEMNNVVKAIKSDIKEGLRPDDILVIVVDDRYAKSYLNAIEEKLVKSKIKSNNLHADRFGLRDFQEEGCVTLSTVHKAKGNEAFMVYIVGVDSLFSNPKVRHRNMLFTAMTRAKGWVRISGIGEPAEHCMIELAKAKKNFPYLKFKYPSEEQISIMKRDLAASAIRRQELERRLDELFEMGEEIGMKELNKLWNKYLGKYAKKGKDERKK